ncbi:hypothetical protein KFK09_000113 [Dendrobium nobile]|uniref:Uncharacterized protein n=1 Tax=Dendrobium nobile TaxID=94219 RepID=A0A8T3CD03_DENNO|nr:hypothetical protein KFK09_000113 [Dendrobium nobile]
MRKTFGLKLCILGLSCLILGSAAENEGNPANEIAKLVNANRTATKLRKLYNNPGLGCMALQFISQCLGNCSSNNTLSCHPPEVDITEVYAPNCGVELATVGIISGYLLGCHWNFLNPEQAFSNVLIRDKRTISLMHGRDLTELGAGFISEKHGGFYWCILFSNETSNSSFVLEEGGKGIEQKTGCFSGSDVPCSSAGMKLLILAYSKLFVFILLLSFLLCY